MTLMERMITYLFAKERMRDMITALDRDDVDAARQALTDVISAKVKLMI